MAQREIIVIDEDLCDGCALCIPACVEGALAIVEGKARLVKDIYCDGMGSCLGHCPQDAITIITREADEYDEAAVEKHLEMLKEEVVASPAPTPAPATATAEPPAQACGCPGSAQRTMAPTPPAAAESNGAAPVTSQLSNWPVELMLVPPVAPHYNNADLLIAADCVPFTYPDFHRRFLAGHILIICCPKLDDAAFYQEKLTQLFRDNSLKSITVTFMEVPCCGGLVMLVKQALAAAGKDIPAKVVKIGIQGDEQQTWKMSELPF